MLPKQIVIQDRKVDVVIDTHSVVVGQCRASFGELFSDDFINQAIQDSDQYRDMIQETFSVAMQRENQRIVYHRSIEQMNR